MILRDFACTQCVHRFEEFEASDAEMELVEAEDAQRCVVCCPKCGADAEYAFKGRSATILEKIIPVYPGCKKKKAGYTHTDHADQPATKIQSGYGGCQGPPIQ